MRLLITGTTGFVGSHLVAALEKEHEVYSINRRATGAFHEVLFDLAVNVTPKLPKADLIIHTAGIVGDGAAEPDDYVEVNVNGTRRLLQATLDAAIPRFLMFSTGGVYAPTASLLTEASPIGPVGTYDKTKWDGEVAAKGFADQLTIQIIRPFFPYGPGQAELRLIPRLVKQIRSGEVITLNDEPGHPILTPIFVGDLVEQVQQMLRIGDPFTLNAGGPEEVSIRQLCTTIAFELGVELRFEIRKNPSTAISNWRCKSSELERVTGLRSETGVGEGIRRLLHYATP